jgi:hypothetical protein
VSWRRGSERMTWLKIHGGLGEKDVQVEDIVGEVERPLLKTFVVRLAPFLRREPRPKNWSERRRQRGSPSASSFIDFPSVL